jgi:hypothetical protein
MAKTNEQKAAEASTEQTSELLAAEQEQGYRGVTVDPTPNENYTVAGVTSGKPTPETDDKARTKAREATGR